MVESPPGLANYALEIYHAVLQFVEVEELWIDLLLLLFILVIKHVGIAFHAANVFRWAGALAGNQVGAGIVAVGFIVHVRMNVHERDDVFPAVAQIVDEGEGVAGEFEQVAQGVLERVALRESFHLFRIFAAGLPREVGDAAATDFLQVVSFPSHCQHQYFLDIAQVHVLGDSQGAFDGYGRAHKFHF